MDKQKKIKIIIFCVIGISVLVVLGLVISMLTGKKSDNSYETSSNLNAQNNSAFTLDDMIKVNKNNTYNSSEGGSILSTRKQRDYSSLSGSEPENPESGGDDDIYESADPDIIRLQQALRNNSNSSPALTTNPVRTNSTQTPSKPVNTTPVSDPPQTTPIVSKEEPAIITQEEEKPQKRNRFFRAEENRVVGNTVAAVVHGEQTVSDKSTLKLRLLEDLVMNDGTLIPKDTYIYGVVSITAERININIASVKIEKNIYAVKRDVYDQDGLKGINVPENVKAEIAKRSSQEMIRDADVNTGNGNILERTAGNVVRASKNILSRDAADIKVTIKSNYKIYLK